MSYWLNLKPGIADHFLNPDFRLPDIFDPSSFKEPYAYAAGNPIMFWDPDGLRWYVFADASGKQSYFWISPEDVERFEMNDRATLEKEGNVGIISEDHDGYLEYLGLDPDEFTIKTTSRRIEHENDEVSYLMQDDVRSYNQAICPTCPPEDMIIDHRSTVLEEITSGGLNYTSQFFFIDEIVPIGKFATATSKAVAQNQAKKRLAKSVARSESTGLKAKTDIKAGGFGGGGSSPKKVIGGNNVTRKPGVTQSRINIAKGRTRHTPIRPKTGKPSKAGFEHILNDHFHRELANSRSIFTITPDRLKKILNRKNVVSSPVRALPGGQYVRTVDTGEIIGNAALKHGGGKTSWIEIYTDKAGNIITAYPVPKPN